MQEVWGVCVLHTGYLARMVAARVKQKEEKNVSTIRGTCPKNGLASAEDLTIEIPRNESPYHRLD